MSKLFSKDIKEAHSVAKFPRSYTENKEVFSFSFCETLCSLSVPLRSLFGVLLLLALLGTAACNSEPHEFAGAELTILQPVPDFTLTGENGPVSLSDFEGKYIYLYFGYTFCPDICPDTLSKLARVREGLGDDADEMQVIMVSVDPERDTPEVLAEYVSHFDPSFVGITGTKAEIDAAGEPFGLFYQKNEGSAATGYLVDHSTRTFLIDQDFNARVAYPFDATHDAMLADLRYLMAQE